MDKNTPIAILGAGYLGRSILERLIKKGHQRLIATRRNKQELDKLQQLSSSLILTIDNKAAVEQAEIIILATKEINFEEVAKDIKNVRAGKFLISLGPTCTLDKLKNLFGEKKPGSLLQ